MSTLLPRIKVIHINVYPRYKQTQRGVIEMGNMHIEINGQPKYVKVRLTHGAPEAFVEDAQDVIKDDCDRWHVLCVLAGLFSRKLDPRKHANNLLSGVKTQPEPNVTESKSTSETDAFEA